MKKMLVAAALAVASVVTGANVALAQDDTFLMINDSSWEIHQFNTYEHGKWSQNWLRTRINPGQSSNLWFNEDGNCNVFARVTYAGGDYAEASIDFCEARTILVTDDGMAWE